jgi:hypothetical protein
MKAPIRLLVTLASFAGCPSLSAPAEKPATETPEARAVAFLVREVPRWAKENKCYSCHNNGDAARALFTAVRLGLDVPKESLADTTRWLSNPRRWDDYGGGKGPESDKKLARIQFAHALVAAIDAGQVKDFKEPLLQAAELVAALQEKDGGWQVDAPGTLGSPVTYGGHLATYSARRTLQKADPVRYEEAIAKAERWLRETPAKSNLDAAAVLLTLDGKDDELRERLLERLKKSQTKEGGWGPHTGAAPEPFDTALVLLALVKHADQTAIKKAIERGRAYLISSQQPDGSWRETTRPPGAESYAQRISTTGWATLALLATRSK